MRILLVNVNTTDSVTEVIAGQARSVAAPGTEIVPLTPFFGPESVEGNFESYLSAVAVMDRVISFDGPYDAVIQAGFGEHGREGLQELCDVPVVDITEAAAHLACLVGRRYSVVTSLDRTVPQIQDRLMLAGLDGRCASVRSSGLGVLDIERDRAAATAAIAAQAGAAVREDGAEVVCLGCAGMAGLDEAVRAATDVPVIDGVTAAVPLAESLVRLGLTTSKIRTYARPRPKAVTGWPIRPGAVPTTPTSTAPETTATTATAESTTAASAVTAATAPSAPPPRRGAALDLP
ncbi:aspartate/glutamate racemase family protein [Nocardiopsis sp. NRRL B-16309]|uniref:aspartate/glutamate racemase family protein n=1 Tax=Nocardiopsis sp. NRRL B-16309 TaxID=1519494 RepID=UPI000A83E916|nr:aspartate/glutamate racemase family protein [Nocardiopsis sp. NRRL B-16309]